MNLSPVCKNTKSISYYTTDLDWLLLSWLQNFTQNFTESISQDCKIDFCCSRSAEALIWNFLERTSSVHCRRTMLDILGNQHCSFNFKCAQHHKKKKIKKKNHFNKPQLFINLDHCNKTYDWKMDDCTRCVLFRLHIHLSLRWTLIPWPKGHRRLQNAVNSRLD